MKKTALTLAFIALLPAASLVVAQQGPALQIQNGRVEARHGASIDREISAASSASSSDPVWIAWRAPMVAGDRDMCSWYSDRLGTTRGMFIDDGMTYVSVGGQIGTERPDRPQVAAPTGPIPLEAGTGVVILARVVGGKVERLRTAGDDCPMDAGGRTVYVLDSVTPAESVRFLATLADGGPTDRTLPDADRRTAEMAVRAIGYHRDPAADQALDRIAEGHRDTNIRHQAASTLGSLRGAHGVATLTRLLASAKESEARRSLTTALGQSRDAAVVPALKALVADPDAKVRAEAVYYFVARGGIAVVPEALKMVSGEKDDGVRKRAVSAIGRLPGDAGVAPLLQLARSTTDAVMRKEAVNALSQSKDPRAIAYMEELLKRL